MECIAHAAAIERVAFFARAAALGQVAGRAELAQVARCGRLAHVEAGHNILGAKRFTRVKTRDQFVSKPLRFPVARDRHMLLYLQG